MSKDIDEEYSSLNWSQCMLCQEDTDEALQNPSGAGKRSDAGAGYKTLAANIQRFHELKSLPICVNPVLLGESSHVADIMKQHEAKWHKNCSNKFNKMKLQRAEKRASDDRDSNASTSSKVTRTSSGGAANIYTNKCFFCDESSGELHQASTFNIDQKVRKYALQLQDTVLLAKLSAGDLMSQEAVYHSKCLSALYNKGRSQESDMTDSRQDRQMQGIALAELVAYIEDSKAESDATVLVFKLAELAKIYNIRLGQLGVETSGRIHTTDLKHRILSHFPDMQAHKEGRDILLAFNKDVSTALKKASTQDFDDEALILKQAANIVRRDIFKTKCSFTGTFSDNCQQESIPKSLLSLVEMVLGGPSIATQSNHSVEAQAALSIAQLVQYNCTRHRRGESLASYHSTDFEPPLPAYLGLLVHAETRKRGLVEKLFDLGLSVSYDRVLALSTKMGNNVCARFEAEKVVCPSQLRHNIFTTSAVDNIDHNPSSTTAQGSLHGTGISLFQHPRSAGTGIDRAQVPLNSDIVQKKTLASLPESYTVVPPLVLPKDEPKIPEIEGPLFSDCQLIPEANNTEYMWLKHVQMEVNAEASYDVNTSWAAYHANASRVQSDADAPLDTSVLLPLFEEQAKSPAMIRHSMELVKKTISFLNPGQVPVMACDQPLYALAKQIQWHYPNSYGEHHLVVMLGGLHVELAALKVLGNWLEDSGWTSAIVQADIASAGTADSYLKASHISRTRHAHQVTASALYILMRKSYTEYLSTVESGSEVQPFDDWRIQREAKAPHFQFWSITLKLQIAVLIFVRSLREGNFQLYKAALTTMTPWFFALDHPNYARWLPVHIRDMMSLQNLHPTVATEFEDGKFVVQKTQHCFSSIPIDQAHEQNNKCVKGDGGAVGLTENSSQLLRWMVSGPEVARVLNEFESSQELVKRKQSKGPDVRHHEQQKGVQSTFRTQVKALCDTIEEMGNPFLETSEDLLVLDTRDIVSPPVVETIRHIEMVGKQQYKTFVEERFVKKTKALSEPIKRNKFPLFSCQPVRSVSKEKQQIASLKQDCSLFSKLYVSCQVRDGDMADFFRHENQTCPPSLAQNGQLRHGQKSDLVACFTKLSPSTNEPPTVDTLLVDGAAIINMLKPGAAKTFQEYSDTVFLPYIKRQIQNVKRLDIIWDEYVANSLKATARSHRGKGVRRRVKPDTRLPGNWEAFLRNDQNKTELFSYLADQVITVPCAQDQQVISTKGQTINCRKPRNDHATSLCPCEHEEADTRLLLHAADATAQGFKKIMIRTVDTDVLILAIAVCQKIEAEELWVSFGTGKNFRYLAAHSISEALGPGKSRALPAFHALTGCDQTSAFSGRGKKSAWETWKIFDQVTRAFEVLSNVPSDESVIRAMPVLEHFVVLLYDKASSCVTVNEARVELFTRKGRSIELIPPTFGALLQHVKRVAYQAGHCWGQMLKPLPRLPSPNDWGWVRGQDNVWEPNWTTLPQASKSCLELLKCGCSPDKGCRGRCKCVKAHVLCTALCKCGGDCDRS